MVVSPVFAHCCNLLHVGQDTPAAHVGSDLRSFQISPDYLLLKGLVGTSKVPPLRLWATPYVAAGGGSQGPAAAASPLLAGRSRGVEVDGVGPEAAPALFSRLPTAAAKQTTSGAGTPGLWRRPAPLSPTPLAAAKRPTSSAPRPHPAPLQQAPLAAL